MSRGREWGEELARLYAEGHGISSAEALRARGHVVLTAEERAMGKRATLDVQLVAASDTLFEGLVG